MASKLPIVIIIFLFICSCRNQEQSNKDCNIDFGMCERIWGEVVKNDIRERFCEYYAYEKNNTLFTRQNFIDYLKGHRLNNDSLVYWLSQIEFDFKLTPDTVYGIASANKMQCVVLEGNCEGLDSMVYLITQPVRECERKVFDHESEVYPSFSEGWESVISDDSFLFGELNAQLKIIRAKFFWNYLYNKGEYFEEDKIRNRNEKRMTEFHCKRESEKKWSCQTRKSEHKNREYVQVAEEMIIEYLDTSVLIRSSTMDSIIIPIFYFEKDQTVIFNPEGN